MRLLLNMIGSANKNSCRK